MGCKPAADCYLLPLDLFRVTAARTRVFNASSSIFSPSWKSMARFVFPSRLELKRPEGSFRAAPLAKVIFTTQNRGDYAWYTFGEDSLSRLDGQKGASNGAR